MYRPVKGRYTPKEEPIAYVATPLQGVQGVGVPTLNPGFSSLQTSGLAAPYGAGAQVVAYGKGIEDAIGPG